MKLTLIGGGGVRAPLFVSAALKRAEKVHLDSLYLFDINKTKLRIMGDISKELARRMGSKVRIIATENLLEALEGAKYVVTSIRVGNDTGRALDERIALRHGVLGQETTGPGGFAMAMRSIPAILEYARLMERVCPEAYMFNFTNPAGLVTQALRDEGYNKTIGICDGANTGQTSVAKWINADPNQLRPEVFGLNHLSWVRHIWMDGIDILGSLLSKPEFLAKTPMNVFEPRLVLQIGMWINEYLYYYYYSDKAVESISAGSLTRGEEVVELNNHLLAQLDDVGVDANPDKALGIYFNYLYRRNMTYMYYARPGSPTPEEADQTGFHQIDFSTVSDEGEGYAGVALDIMQGLEGKIPIYTALNVPNEKSIDCMLPTDVVEVSCKVDHSGISTLPIGVIPEHQELLMRAVKQYEKLTIQAIRERSCQKAVMALMAHPLVLSYSLASTLVHEYLEAHRSYVGVWN